ncbi:MAG: DNA-processing protein DprA [Moraxellaceae bacterium]|nr:DNA-processing protein DprA [Moraxellaceae bacterium]
MTTLSSPSASADWLRLWRLLQQSSLSFHRLAAVWPTPAAILSATPAEWRAAGASPGQAQRLARWQDGSDPELVRELDEGVAADMDWCSGPNQRLLTLPDADYPPLLREIADPPPLLFLCGNPELLALPQVGIVGSRHPSHGGRQDAGVLAAELVQAGLVVTSGMARGIDGAAHAGALRAGGRTVAVLGCGADTAYPREHGALYRQIIDSGSLVVSEFLPGSRPLAAHFPRRNRVISGLSFGLLVVEATPDSGSLITARLASEQGRTVWALPGSRHHPQAQGCLLLIREGATLVTETAHILADLPAMVGFMRAQLELPTDVTAALPPTPARPPLSKEARALLLALGQECRHADWLIGATGLPPAHVLQLLSRLELEGCVVAVPGGYERLPAGAVT